MGRCDFMMGSVSISARANLGIKTISLFTV
jgi:hypothetical protein